MFVYIPVKLETRNINHDPGSTCACAFSTVSDFAFPETR